MPAEIPFLKVFPTTTPRTTPYSFLWFLIANWQRIHNSDIIPCWCWKHTQVLVESCAFDFGISKYFRVSRHWTEETRNNSKLIYYRFLNTTEQTGLTSTKWIDHIIIKCCIPMWVFKLSFWVNSLPHIVHLNCFGTPHSNVKCRRTFHFRTYLRPQPFGQCHHVLKVFELRFRAELRTMKA